MAGLFEVKVKIAVPPQYLWKVLIDFGSYSDWNPFIQKIEGKPEVGSVIQLQVKINPDREAISFSKEMIVSLKENQHLSYDSHFLSSSLFHSIRWQTIQVLEDGNSCLYHSYQKLAGLASWPVSWILGDKISAGSEVSSIALKHRAEYLYLIDQQANIEKDKL